MIRRPVLCLLLAALGGCSLLNIFDSDDPRKPVPLTEFTQTLKVAPVWNYGIGGAGRFFFSPANLGGDLIVAGTDGNIARINAFTGAQVWKISVDDKLSAGVGADAGTFAVATTKGDLIAFDLDGKQRWRISIGGQVLSPPGVGDGIVVARTTDGRFLAFDSGTGQKRWIYQRAPQPLVLRVAPGMVIYSGTLYAGLAGGRLIAVTDSNGGLRWDVAVTIPRGATELERVADVMGTPVLGSRQVCVATFQGRAGCFDQATGSTVWTHEISTTSGMGVDQHGAYISDEKSVVQALAHPAGVSLWKNDKMMYRALGTPTPYRGAVVVADYAGFVHWLSEDDGALIARVPTDGSIIRVAPIVVSNGTAELVVVQTVNGGIYAFSSQ
jgi:outer membrane protein assembly factor BamB